MTAPTVTVAGRDGPLPARAWRVLLVCGIASSLLYATMNVIGAMQYEGYSSLSQSVSELSAIGAPSRPLWVTLCLVYNVLVIAFGLGVWSAARPHRSLRVVGGLLVAHGLIGFVWPPMHQRGAGFTLTDTMHIVVTIVTVFIMLLTIAFGAAAFGKRFRIYSIATILAHVVFGILIGMDGPRIAANLPTPWAGLTERINIGVYMLWVVIFALALLRAQEAITKREAPATRRVARALGYWLLG